MRFVLFCVALASLLFALAVGCESAEMSGAPSDGDVDSDTDTDTDSDTDTGGVPIEYPEALNPFMNPNGLMTGPISPPPEDVFGDELDDDEDDWDAGEPEAEDL